MDMNIINLKGGGFSPHSPPPVSDPGMYVLMLSHMNIFISHNVHAHALSLSTKLRARLMCIDRTPQRGSRFLPVWLHQHEKEKPASCNYIGTYIHDDHCVCIML